MITQDKGLLLVQPRAFTNFASNKILKCQMAFYSEVSMLERQEIPLAMTLKTQNLWELGHK